MKAWPRRFSAPCAAGLLALAAAMPASALEPESALATGADAQLVAPKERRDSLLPLNETCAPQRMQLALSHVNTGWAVESINHDSYRRARLDGVFANRERWIVSLYDDDDRLRRDDPDVTRHAVLWVFEPWTAPCRGRIFVETIDDRTGAIVQQAEDFNTVTTQHGLLLYAERGGDFALISGADETFAWLYSDGREVSGERRNFRTAAAEVSRGLPIWPAVRQRTILRAEDGLLSFVIDYAPSFNRRTQHETVEDLRADYAVTLRFEPTQDQ